MAKNDMFESNNKCVKKTERTSASHPVCKSHKYRIVVTGEAHHSNAMLRKNPADIVIPFNSNTANSIVTIMFESDSIELLKFRCGRAYLSDDDFMRTIGVDSEREANLLLYTYPFPFLAEEFFVRKTEMLGEKKDALACRHIRETEKRDVFPCSRFDEDDIRRRVGNPKGKLKFTTSCALSYERIDELIDALIDFKHVYEKMIEEDPTNSKIPFFREFLCPIDDDAYAHRIEPWLCVEFLKNKDLQERYFAEFEQDRLLMNFAAEDIKTIVTIDSKMRIRETEKTPEELTVFDREALEILEEYSR